MPYDQYTLGGLTSDIQSLISDTGGVYFTPAEIQFAINEFLREWSTMTGYWKQQVSLPLPYANASNPWIDLSIAFPAQRPRTVTINAVCQEIQYHLCEIANGSNGIGMTAQFSVAEIIAAIVRARNRFVLDTQLPLTLHQNYPVVSPPDGRFYLPDTTLLVHRAYWLDSQGVYTVLQRTDGFAEDSYAPDWTVEPDVRPFGYSISETRPTEIALYPTTFASGIMEFLSVDSNQITTTLAIPDDFAPAVKYAALMDLLTIDAETYDPVRSAYCKKRYDNYVQAAKIQNTVIRGYVNGIPAILGTLASLDSKQPYWRGLTGKPTYTACASEIVTFFPTAPAGTSYGGVLDICTAAPIPTGPASYINLPSSEISVLVDFVQHYLSIKMGGLEMQQTFGQFDAMQKAAAQRNALLDASTRYMTGLLRQPNLELAQQPDLLTPPL